MERNIQKAVSALAELNCRANIRLIDDSTKYIMKK
jgi:hypothetical protein